MEIWIIWIIPWFFWLTNFTHTSWDRQFWKCSGKLLIVFPWFVYVHIKIHGFKSFLYQLTNANNAHLLSQSHIWYSLTLSPLTSEIFFGEQRYIFPIASWFCIISIVILKNIQRQNAEIADLKQMIFELGDLKIFNMAAKRVKNG